MKKFAVVAMIVLFAGALFADRVILRDATVVEGKIIQVTGKGVEIDPEGDVPFDLITRDKIAKIVYDDGREVQIALDKLYLYEGKIIEGKILQVSPTDIQYTPKDSTQNVTIPRDKVQTILFMDGREINMEKEQGAQIDLPVERVPGFHHSIIRIAAIFGFGNMFGQLINREEEMFNDNEVTINTLHGLHDWDSRNAFINTGGELDVMLPAFSFNQTGAFSFTGIKLGARGRYVYSWGYMSIYDDYDNDNNDSNDERFYGQLIRYQAWMAGPVVYFIFSPRANTFNLLINFYVLAGQIFDGDYTAAPALRDAGITFNRQNYHSSFDGFTVRIGWGPHFALNRWFPITVGINVYYAYSYLEMDNPILAYNSAKTRFHHEEWGGEVSLGIHF